ncbi:MAG: urease accessory UreF family protein [Polyangiales bacterium]
MGGAPARGLGLSHGGLRARGGPRGPRRRGGRGRRALRGGAHRPDRGGLAPLVGAAHDDPARFTALDDFTATTLWSHVASRASRAQGRALLDVAARSFDVTALTDARAAVVVRGLGHGHLAPVFGLVTRALDVARDEALATYLHLALRGALSAAVRLGGCGPTEAQAIHRRMHPASTRPSRARARSPSTTSRRPRR